jgi:hypothetical protein
MSRFASPLVFLSCILMACAPGPPEGSLAISGELVEAWELGGAPIARGVVRDLNDPQNTARTDQNGLWMLYVAPERFVGAVSDVNGFLPYAHIVDTEFGDSPTPEIELLPFTSDALTELYSGDYGYSRQEGRATLVVMVADEDGGDYTGATVTVSSDYEESLVEAVNMDLVPGTVSGEPWAEVLFVNVAPGSTTVEVVDLEGNLCASDLPIDLEGDTYVYLDTVCPGN